MNRGGISSRDIFDKKGLLLWVYFLSIIIETQAQSFEVMPGANEIFIDAQYLKFFNKTSKFSLFSRARATSSYAKNQTNLFTGAYLNYTTKSGFGGTVLGRIATGGVGIDTGIHYFKTGKSILIYVLPSINVNNTLSYSCFSIFQFTPELRNNWKLYTSLELFSLFGQFGHLYSVQRMRFGLDKMGYQFGAAINLNEGKFGDIELNPGMFLRKQF